MGDQSETPKNRPARSSGLSMAELNEALPSPSSGGQGSQFHPVPATQLQYQLPHPGYQYQQPYSTAQSPSSYSGGMDTSQYYQNQGGQQQMDIAQGGYQYGGKVGYRNNSGTNMFTLPQFATPMTRPMQPVQGQSYPMPRFQYQQAPQPYQPNLGRAMSLSPSYSAPQSGRAPQQFSQQSQYPVFASPFQNAVPPQLFSDDDSAADVERMLPRGPPRKPKQSGFALWVGNLPRDVRLEDLKDFFALGGLESIFLIRKSNCAFVNYRTEEDCAAALATFNDKMFHNVRLVCRLRRSSPVRPHQVPTNTQAGDDKDESGLLQPEQSEKPSSQFPAETTNSPEARDTPQSSSTPQSPSTPSKDRYFILKSLTKEDLLWSVTNKVWATQPHNEVILNEAFKNSQNVYLIFSVNKSGEFFGYARMASEINSTAENEKIKIGDKSDAYNISEHSVPLLAGPKTTVTPRTNSAPRGKIFEDDVRGTVFWEVAEFSEDEDLNAQGDQSSKEETKWGNPFKIEWIKWDAALLFQRTRTLRNPWNGNREIKISRDGTEIEPTVGARLLKEFENDALALGYSEASEVTRRMSYPILSRQNMPSAHIMYQTSPQMAPQGWQYVPFTTSSPPSAGMYNYPQATQFTQQYGGSPPQSMYPQPPR